MSNAKLEVGQLVVTSSTPPGNLGLYAYDQDTIGVVGDILCSNPRTGEMSSVVTAQTNTLTGGGVLSAGGSTVGFSGGGIAYDSQGRVSDHDGWTITYDASGRVASQTDGTKTQTFTYDSAGRYTGFSEA